jgi:hypothetical protein
MEIKKLAKYQVINIIIIYYLVKQLKVESNSDFLKEYSKQIIEY